MKMYHKNKKKKIINNKKDYTENKLDHAVRMVVSYKWSQKSVCQAFGIPRQVLCNKLKREEMYSNRAPYKPYSPADMAEAIRLVEEENVPQSVAAMRCGIPKATLYCRIGKRQGTLDKKYRSVSKNNPSKNSLSSSRRNTNNSSNNSNAGNDVDESTVCKSESEPEAAVSASEGEGTNNKSEDFPEHSNNSHDSENNCITNGVNVLEAKLEDISSGSDMKAIIKKAVTLIKKKKMAPGVIAKRFGISRRVLAKHLPIGFMRSENPSVPIIFEAKDEDDKVEESKDKKNIESIKEESSEEHKFNNNNNDKSLEQDDQESNDFEGALQIKEEDDEEDDEEEEEELSLENKDAKNGDTSKTDDGENESQAPGSSANSVKDEPGVLKHSRGRAYTDDLVKKAIDMVIFYKWTQRDASRAYGVPRKLLHDKLKENSQYKSRSTYRSYTQEDLLKAVRLVTVENMPQRTAAKMFGIPRATLHGYVLREGESPDNSLTNGFPELLFNSLTNANFDNPSLEGAINLLNSGQGAVDSSWCSADSMTEELIVPGIEPEFDPEEMYETCVSDFLECSLQVDDGVVNQESEDGNEAATSEVSSDTKSKLKEKLTEKRIACTSSESPSFNEELIMAGINSADEVSSSDQSSLMTLSEKQKRYSRRRPGDLSVYTREGTLRKRPQYRLYTKEALMEAIRLVLEENVPQRSVCQKYGIPRTTLHDHICRVTKTGVHAPKNKEAIDSKDGITKMDVSSEMLTEEMLNIPEVSIKEEPIEDYEEPCSESLTDLQKNCLSSASIGSEAPQHLVKDASTASHIRPQETLSNAATSSTSAVEQVTPADFTKDARDFLLQYKAMGEALQLTQVISQIPALSSQLIPLIRNILDKQLSEMKDYGVHRLALLFQVRQHASNAFSSFIKSTSELSTELDDATNKVASGELTLDNAAQQYSVEKDVLRRNVYKASLKRVFDTGAEFEQSILKMSSVVDSISDANDSSSTAACASSLDPGTKLTDAKLAHITQFIKSISKVYLPSTVTVAATQAGNNSPSTPVVSQVSSNLNTVSSTVSTTSTPNTSLVLLPNVPGISITPLPAASTVSRVTSTPVPRLLTIIPTTVSQSTPKFELSSDGPSSNTEPDVGTAKPMDDVMISRGPESTDVLNEAADCSIVTNNLAANGDQDLIVSEVEDEYDDDGEEDKLESEFVIDWDNNEDETGADCQKSDTETSDVTKSMADDNAGDKVLDTQKRKLCKVINGENPTEQNDDTSEDESPFKKIRLHEEICSKPKPSISMVSIPEEIVSEFISAASPENGCSSLLAKSDDDDDKSNSFTGFDTPESSPTQLDCNLNGIAAHSVTQRKDGQEANDSTAVDNSALASSLASVESHNEERSESNQESSILSGEQEQSFLNNDDVESADSPQFNSADQDDDCVDSTTEDTSAKVVGGVVTVETLQQEEEDRIEACEDALKKSIDHLTHSQTVDNVKER